MSKYTNADMDSRIINDSVSKFTTLQIGCRECGAEYTITDDVDGSLFVGVDTIYCICCSIPISLN